MLQVFGVYLCNSRAYDVLQAAARRVPGLKRQVCEGVKTAAEEVRLGHQVCKGHVKRNTDTWVTDLRATLGSCRNRRGQM